MRILAVYANQVGPLNFECTDFCNSWPQEAYDKVLLSGPNGCGKSTLLRAVAYIWQALGHWMDTRTELPAKNEAKKWFSKWRSFAVVLDGIDNNKQQVGVFIGFEADLRLLTGNEIISNLEYPVGKVAEIKGIDENVQWIGEYYTKLNPSNRTKGNYFSTSDDWLEKLSQLRRKMVMSHESVDMPNIIHLDAEQRRWVTPSKNIGELTADSSLKRWQPTYEVNEDWHDQLEASLIALKTTTPDWFEQIIADLNQFFFDKQIQTHMPIGTKRLTVCFNDDQQRRHSFDELSSGEHQVLIMIFMVSRWLQNGGIVLLDEPDMHLNPSLVKPLLKTLEKVVEKKNGQIIYTSHSPDVWARYERFGLRVKLNQGHEIIKSDAVE